MSNMANLRETANVNLPQLSPVRCGKCGGTAPLSVAEIMRDGDRIKENFIYACPDCGAEMKYAVKS